MKWNWTLLNSILQVKQRHYIEVGNKGEKTNWAENCENRLVNNWFLKESVAVVIFFAWDYTKSAQTLDFDVSVTLQRRSRAVETFGQFCGSACRESLGDRESCTPSEPCVQPPLPTCADTEFQCESGTSATWHNIWKWACDFRCNAAPLTGTCIKRRLSCNGDYDCEDGSDEDCDPTTRPCGSNDIQNDEQGRTAGYG